jgi:hypothetical protein
MKARYLTRHFAGYTSAVALIALGGLTAACGRDATKNGPTAITTTATTTTIAMTISVAATAPPPVAPTENNLNPNSPNSFTPRAIIPPPAYVPPTVHQNPYLNPSALPPG